MAEIVDFESAREDKLHLRREKKVRDIRKAFKLARESWEPKSKSPSRLKNFLKHKNTKKKK